MEIRWISDKPGPGPTIWVPRCTLAERVERIGWHRKADGSLWLISRVEMADGEIRFALIAPPGQGSVRGEEVDGCPRIDYPMIQRDRWCKPAWRNDPKE